MFDFIRRERTRPDPAEHRSIGPTDDVFVHLAVRNAAEPAATGIVGRVGRQSAWCKAERFDHRAGPGAPQPGPLRDQRVRHLQRQGACRKRHAVGDQMRAEVRKQAVGPLTIGGGIDEPGEGRGEVHGPMMTKQARLCHGQSLTERRAAAMSRGQPKGSSRQDEDDRR
ncbi:hypothetical protein ACVIHC_005719 [Bradyrhizobium diazoefficiens]